MTRSNYFLPIIAFLLIFTACKQDASYDTDSLALVPEDASMVTSVDVQQLMDKMDFEEVKNMAFYQDLVEQVADENPALAAILKDPVKSGVDLTKNIYFAYDVEGKNISNSFGGMYFDIADESAFQAMVSSAGLNNIENKGGHSLVSKKGMVVSWNGQHGMIGGGSKRSKNEENVALLYSGEQKSISGNKDFKKSMKGDHDITTWISSNGIAESSEAAMALTFAKIDPDALKDNFLNGFVDFNDGEMVAESIFNLNSGLTKDADKLFKNSVKTNFSKYIPSEDLAFVMSAALDMAGINRVLTDRPSNKSFANFAMKEYGLTVDDVTKAFDGDLVVAMYGGENKEAQKGLFATPIDDMSVFKKIITLGKDYEVLKEDSKNMYQFDATEFKNFKFKGMEIDKYAWLMVHDDMLFISGDKEMLNKVRGGLFSGVKKIDKEINNNIMGNIFSAFLDAETIQKYNDKVDAGALNDLIMSAARNDAKFNMEFKDKSKNSLKLLMEMMNENYLKQSGGKKSI